MGFSELSIRLLCQQQLGMALGLCCGIEQEEGVVGNHVCSEQTQSTNQEETWGGKGRIVQISPLENSI